MISQNTVKRSIDSRAKWLLAWAVMACAFAGCGGADRSHFDIVPSQDRARAALETALAAWQRGEQPGKLSDGSRSIQVLDHIWKAGSQLTAFEITPVDDKPGPRWFSVKLFLKDAAEPELAYYAVVGIEPLWVFREGDFNAACGIGE